MIPKPTTLCVAAIGSMTMAMKAQHVLQGRGIAARVLALSPGESRYGCAYGVAFPHAVEEAAKAALAAAHITASQYFTKDANRF